MNPSRGLAISQADDDFELNATLSVAHLATEVIVGTRDDATLAVSAKHTLMCLVSADPVQLTSLTGEGRGRSASTCQGDAQAPWSMVIDPLHHGTSVDVACSTNVLLPWKHDCL